MFDSITISTVVALAFIFLALSLLCTAINEWIAQILALRARTLEEAIRHILDDSSGSLSVEKFYKHPLIENIRQPVRFLADHRYRNPSYISSQTFSSVLFDLIKPVSPITLDDVKKKLNELADGAEKALLQLATNTGTDLRISQQRAGYISEYASEVLNALLKSNPTQTLADIRKSIDQLPDDPFKVKCWLIQVAATASDVSGLRETVNRLARTPASTLFEIVLPADPSKGSLTLAELREKISTTVKDPTLQKSLLTQIDQAGDDLAKARIAVETWYDSVMERVSGWYKRKIQWVLLGIALIVSLIANADAIAMVRAVHRDPLLRQSLVDAAKTLTERNATLPETLDALKQFDQETREIILPLGWNDLVGGPLEQAQQVLQRILNLEKIIGLFATMLLISLGAPFWFDVLRFSIRATGKVPVSVASE